MAMVEVKTFVSPPLLRSRTPATGMHSRMYKWSGRADSTRPDHSISYTASSKTYVALCGSDKCYLLLASPLTLKNQDPKPATASTTLTALSTLLSKILDGTTVPVPRPIAHDVSGGGGRWDFGWLLLVAPGPTQTHPSTSSLASLRSTLSPSQLARVELRLGTYLRALHGITNEWFGLPIDTPALEAPAAPSLSSLFAVSQDGEGADGEDMTRYSWQDTFVLQLEGLLDEVYDNTGAGGVPGPEINIEELRRYLSRAIGSFLFEDVEMPRLIWVTGSEEDIVVSLALENLEEGQGSTESEGGAEADIAYILPTFGHALWGDPLMEAWFLPPGSSKATNVGYFGDERGTLIVFPRHKTKRVWYTVYLALVIVVEDRRSRGRGEEETEKVAIREKVQWAREILPQCIGLLKDAPCY
ncbi:hypothetical protein PAXRUDRAFT_827418 [Paxillus rubicundulus Ve08.2h10]|uniref:Aminoglycoside phosphotransferase domain-containing protein n=1 Tax=Paxillus rubicundulus Ve08.2h10 TaxID=930991 RepID=A0A0D0DCR7_9AGAM|nr:hypothetical protein PAXRUDRAFT_827418 [Paxillus rubicundulus Ve08.2h10]